MANNNYPQITSVTSEALQAQIRNLLPSQEGFGTDLMAQNVIVPIIDLTSAAEGSSTPEILQTAWDFATSYSKAENSTVTAINNTGFWRVGAIYSGVTSNSSGISKIYINSGLTTKTIWSFDTNNTTTATHGIINIPEFVVFLRSGDSLVLSSSQSDMTIESWSRQIADVNGTFTQPLGFTPQ